MGDRPRYFVGEEEKKASAWRFHFVVDPVSVTSYHSHIMSWTKVANLSDTWSHFLDEIPWYANNSQNPVGNTTIFCTYIRIPIYVIYI